MVLRARVARARGKPASWASVKPDIDSSSVAGFHINLLTSTLECLFPVTTLHPPIPSGWKDGGRLQGPQFLSEQDLVQAPPALSHCLNDICCLSIFKAQVLSEGWGAFGLSWCTQHACQVPN